MTNVQPLCSDLAPINLREGLTNVRGAAMLIAAPKLRRSREIALRLLHRRIQARRSPHPRPNIAEGLFASRRKRGPQSGRPGVLAAQRDGRVQNPVLAATPALH